MGVECAVEGRERSDRRWVLPAGGGRGERWCSDGRGGRRGGEEG